MISVHAHIGGMYRECACGSKKVILLTGCERDCTIIVMLVNGSDCEGGGASLNPVSRSEMMLGKHSSI